MTYVLPTRPCTDPESGKPEQGYIQQSGNGTSIWSSHICYLLWILPNVPTRTWGNSPLMNTHRVYSVRLLGLQTSLKLSVSTPAPPGIEPSPHLHPHPPWPGWRALIFSPHSRGERLDVLTLSQEQISLIHKTEPYHILRMSSHRDSLIHHPQIHSNCFNANPNILWSNLMGLNIDPFQSVLSNLVFPSPLYKKHPVPPAPPLQPCELQAPVRELAKIRSTVCDSVLC